MADTVYEIGLVLKADGSGLTADVRLSKEELERLNASVRKAGGAAKSASGDFDRAGDAARRSGRDYGKAEQGARGLTGSLGSLRGALGTLAGAFAAREVAQYAGRLVQLDVQFERLETRIEFLTGSQRAAAREMEYAADAADAADRLAASEAGLVESRAQLIALEQAGLISRERGLAITEGLIDAQKALGADTNQLKLVTYGLSQAMGMANVQMEEYRQITDPLPGLAQRIDAEIRKMTDGAVSGFRELNAEGESTREMFAEALVRALGTFEGAAENAGEKGEGILQRLQNEITTFQRILADRLPWENFTRNATTALGKVNAALRPEEKSLDQQIAEAQAVAVNALFATTGLKSETARRDAERRLAAAEETLERLRALKALAAAEEAAAAETARQQELQRQRDAALALIGDAPQTRDQKADAVRAQIAAINAAIHDGRLKAEEAAPALAGYADQLERLLKPRGGGGSGGMTEAEKLAKETADRHADAIAQIGEGLVDILPKYDEMRERARLWHEEALAGLDPQAKGYAGFVAEAKRVYYAMLADIAAEQAEEAQKLQARDDRERLRRMAKMGREIAQRMGKEEDAAKRIADAHEQSVKRIDAALLSLKPKYDQMRERARLWREETLKGLKPGSGEAARVETAYQGKLAAIDREEAKELQREQERAAKKLERERERADRERLARIAGMGREIAKRWREQEREEQRLARERERLTGGLIAGLERLDPSYERAAAAAMRWRDETMAALTKAGIATEAHGRMVGETFALKMQAAYEADLQRRTDWAAGIERGLDDIETGYADFASRSESLLTNWAKSGEDAFVQLATKGKFEVGSLVDAVLADLARLAYRQSLAPAVNSIGTALIGGLGSLFGGAPPPVASGGTIGPGGTGVFHRGGVAGIDVPDVRRLPHYHSGGLAGDEQLAVLRRGEPVFTPRQFDSMNGLISALAANAAKPVMVAGGDTRIDIRTEPGLEVRQSQSADGGTRLDIFRAAEGYIAGNLAAGRGPVASAMQRRFVMQNNFSGGRG